MIENVVSPKQYLYHYTKACTVLNYIIPSHTIRLGSYTGTNDPKESKDWSFFLGTNGEQDLRNYKMLELSKWLSAALKEKTKLVCFSTDSDGLSGSHFRDIFKRGFCKPRMWAQYADRHSGACLVFDRQKLEALIDRAYSKDNLVLSGEVTYRNRSVAPKLFDSDDQQYSINVDFLEMVGPDAYIEAHLQNHYKRLFFEKMEDWRDESEWRCIVFSQTSESLYLDFEDSMVGIMFGENTAEDVMQKIMDKTESWSLSYMGLKWNNCSPWYDFWNPRYMSKSVQKFFEAQ